VGLDERHPCPPLILKLTLLCRLRWLAGVTVAEAPTAGVLAVIAARSHPIVQGQAPPLVRHRRWPGESSSYANARLGLLPCCDVGLCLLIGVEPRLLHMRLSLSCKSNSLLGRESSTAERAPSLCRRKD
jgi:hypothetical protein